MSGKIVSPTPYTSVDGSEIFSQATAISPAEVQAIQEKQEALDKLLSEQGLAKYKLELMFTSARSNHSHFQALSRGGKVAVSSMAVVTRRYTNALERCLGALVNHSFPTALMAWATSCAQPAGVCGRTTKSLERFSTTCLCRSGLMLSRSGLCSWD